MTDYPDWQSPQAQATAINTTGVPLIRNITVLNTFGPVAAGATSTTFDQAYPVFAEGYLLEVIPQNPGTRIFACDVVITHLDASNNVVGIEQVTVSNIQNAGTETSIIRGRLLGTSLQLQVQVANSAWINGVTGGVVTADSIKLRACALYTYVPGAGKRSPVIQSAGGLLLASSFTVPLPGTAGTVEQVGVLPDYTGAVVVAVSTAVGGGFTYAARIESFTVSNGTAFLNRQDFPSVTVNAPSINDFSLPSCFNIASVIQKSAVAASAGFGVLVTAADQ